MSRGRERALRLLVGSLSVGGLALALRLGIAGQP